MDLSENVLDEIRLRVLCGYANRKQVFDSILDLYWEELGMIAEPSPTHPNAVKIVANDPTNDAINERVRTAIDEAFARKAEEMKSWPAVTDCERLRNAFDLLDKQGIVTLENAGFTQQEGRSAVAELALARDSLGGEESRGYCFFTRQDVFSAAEGDGLLLAYASYEEDPPKPVATPPAVCPICKGRGWIAPSDPTQFPAQCSCRNLVAAPTPEPTPTPTAAQKVGAAVLAACRDAGLTVEWNGAADTRIKLPQFRWQRRIVVPSDIDIRDFIESWELELRAGGVDLRKRFVTSGFATVVQARRTTAGFDLRLSRKLRAAWQSLGASEPGHVCHLGAPHTFVRAGEHTSLAAQSALENIREEAIPLRERGVRAVKARADHELATQS